MTGGWLHVCHVSTARGAEMIRLAKERGVNVTAEVMPHHLVMTDAWVAGERILHNTNEQPGAAGIPMDPNTKVNPPLRPVTDTEGAPGGTPEWHVRHRGHRSCASCGIGQTGWVVRKSRDGDERAGSGVANHARAGSRRTPETVDAIRWLTIEPAKILQMPLGTLSPGVDADVCIFDPDETWIVSRETCAQKHKYAIARNDHAGPRSLYPG